jgi:Ni,Fe-hydrogenase III large subunit
VKRVTSRNGRLLPLADIPELTINEFRDEILDGFNHGERVILFFGTAFGHNVKLTAVSANDAHSSLHLSSTIIGSNGSYESLTNDIPYLHIFEREIFEEFGITPVNHPWLKPVRYSHTRYNCENKISNYPFFIMSGDEIHEVGVGPVHAGVIEPGHFRFMCDGENIHHLEIQLGYQHRGVEELFLNNDIRQQASLAESVAGDTVIGHIIAWASAVESLADISISRRAEAVRCIALELERIGIHIGDLSAISNDIGYLSGNAIFGALRTVVINTTQALCGNRFGRGLIRCGGVAFDIDDSFASQIRSTLNEVAERVTLMSDAFFSDPGVLSRLEKTGVVDNKTANTLGLSGPAARASAIRRDVRADHPFASYKNFPVYARTMEGGDVFSRAYIRYIEIQQSIDLIIEILDNFPDESSVIEPEDIVTPNALVVSMTEGWRGEIVHCAMTGDDGSVIRYKIKDPSLHNWNALAMSVRRNGISDFPLCNKSFNLSYCGFDL